MSIKDAQIMITVIGVMAGFGGGMFGVWQDSLPAGLFMFVALFALWGDRL